MDSTIITTIIAAVAAIVGGAIAAISSTWNTRHKIKELEVLLAKEKEKVHLAA